MSEKPWRPGEKAAGEDAFCPPNTRKEEDPEFLAALRRAKEIIEDSDPIK